MPESKNTNMRPHLVPLLLLLTATFVVYGRTLGYDFIFNWDDDAYVLNNQALTKVTIFNIKQAFTQSYIGNYAPVHILSYLMDKTFWGMNPNGYHLTNVIIHAANGLFFYLLLFKWSRNRLWAFAAAFLFLVHPVQVESVAWISQRKNLLAMFFFLTAFAAWQEYREQKSVPWYVVSLVTFLMALLAKAVAVIFPVIVLLYDARYAHIEKGWRRLKDKLPFVAVALSVGLLTIQMQGGQSFHGGNPWNTFLTMSTVLVRYFRLFFWPTQLSAIYDPPIRTGIDGEVLAGLLLLAILTGVAMLLWKRRSEAFFWYSLFFLGLLPVSQIIPMVTLMNDRYLYFPMLGVAPLLLWPLRSAEIFSPTRRLLVTLLAIILLLAAVSAWQRAAVWQNASTLWTDAVYKTPSDKTAWGKMIEAYARHENLEDIPSNLVNNPEFRRGMEVPIMQFMSRYDTFNAHRILDQLAVVYPDFPEVWYLEGVVYSRKGEVEKAEEMFWHALTLNPKFSKAYFGLGNSALERRDYASASTFYAKAEATGGPVEIIALNQAAAAVMSGNAPGAKWHLDRAFHAGLKDCEAFTEEEEFKALKGQPEFQYLLLTCQEMKNSLNRVH
jgi:hypothetical protein